MSSFNKWIGMGNLTRDPEVRVTPKGTSVCQLGLAVNESYTTADGQKREDVTFVDIDAFGKQAEVIGKYFSKGKPILVEGRLKLDSWESKEGGKRSKLKVILERFSFVGGKDAPQGDAGPARASDDVPMDYGKSKASEADPEDDGSDCPF